MVGGPTLIRVPSAPHNGGDTYLVKAQMVGSKWQANQPITVDSFAISLTAVKLIAGKYSFGGASTNPALYVKGFDNIGAETGTYPSICAIASPTECAAKYSLPLGLRFGVTVDLSQKITGWLHGRVKGPVIEVSTNKFGGSTLSVNAEPIKIPVNAIWVDNNSAPQTIKDFYKGKNNSGSPLFGNDPLTNTVTGEFRLNVPIQLNEWFKHLSFRPTNTTKPYSYGQLTSEIIP